VDEKQVEATFAHTYFTRIINEETECFEDYVDLLVASFAVHFPALKRECEHFICRELLLVSLKVRVYNPSIFVGECRRCFCEENSLAGRAFQPKSFENGCIRCHYRSIHQVNFLIIAKF
jgi:hypothetical protein